MKKVMVVDDDLVNRKLIASYLENVGYSLDDIYEFSDGLRTYEYLKKDNNIGLILLDVFMPKMDGFEFLEKIKQDDKTKNIPVIIITTDDKLRNDERVKLADDFVVKPINFDKFVKTVSYYLID